MPIPQRAPGESKDEYIGRCIASEVAAGKPQDQAAAICYMQLSKTRMAETEPEIDTALLQQCLLDVQGMNPSYSGAVALKICKARLAIGAKERAIEDKGIVDPETL
jgi:hypothetical protein